VNRLESLRLPLVGRQEETKKIAEAIQSQGMSILYLEGVAGIGKTALLEEAQAIAARDKSVICPPIIDFYDTQMHAHRELEAAIAKNLASGKAAFKEYWAQRRRAEHTPPHAGQTMRHQEEELWQTFVKAYNSVAARNRVLLRFDTAERLEYEQEPEEIMADCEVSPQEAPSWEWLSHRIGELKNTAILIAARPTPSEQLWQGLLEAHGEQVVRVEVSGFSLEETKAYFQATEFGSEVVDESSDMVAKVHLLTDGRPILIALALDWLARGTWEPSIYPASLEELDTLRAEAQAEKDADGRGGAVRKWNEITRKFEIALVQHIRTLDHGGLDMAVKIAALARKGCNAELLALLMGISPTKARMLARQMQKLSFVKRPRGHGDLFFLHDEMYDLVENYVWRADWPDHSEQARLDGIIADWYTGRIAELTARIRATRNWRGRARWRRQQQQLIVDRLYYQLDADPRDGYRWYRRLDEEAIGSRELEWDVLLRNEALWFISNRDWRLAEKGPTRVKNGKIERSPWVDYDARRMWVGRYTARGEWKKAVDIAQKLLEKPRHSDEAEVALYRPGLMIALGTAQAYLGGDAIASAIHNFDEGVRLIEESKWMTQQEHQNPWLTPYLQGTASLYKGLTLRNTLRLSDAAQAYSLAIRHFHDIEYRHGEAEAANNLAYIYAREGRASQAKAFSDHALRIREALGDEYPIGLSLNTKGIIFERLGHPIEAYKLSQQALEIFQRISNERGIVLAEINLGRSLRRKGRASESREAGDFQEAEEHLADAVLRLEAWGPDREVFYEVEAYAEWGCLYRDWVATLAEEDQDDPEELLERLDQAAGKLERARDLAREAGAGKDTYLFQYIDATEDLARVYYWRARVDLEEQPAHWKGALDLLDEAQRQAERIRDRDEYPFLMGKIHHQLARIARERGEGEGAARHYAWAAGLLEEYSRDLPELYKTVADACDWLYELQSADEARQWLDVMQATMIKAGLDSTLLKEEADSRLLARFVMG
jgi:tetratricopeptide (TPR) repeat protein